MKRKRSTTLSGREPSSAKARQAPPALLKSIEARRAQIVRWLLWAGLPPRDAPDIAQDVVMAAWLAGAKYDATQGALSTWIRAITRNHASHYRNRARVRLESLVDPATGPWLKELSASTPEDTTTIAEQLRGARSLLARLAPERAEVLLRHELKGEIMKDIAALLGIPEATGYTRLRLARADLARAIRQEEAKQRGPKPANLRGDNADSTATSKIKARVKRHTNK